MTTRSIKRAREIEETLSENFVKYCHNTGSVFVSSLVLLDKAMQFAQIEHKIPLGLYNRYMKEHSLQAMPLLRELNQPAHWSHCKKAQCTCQDKLRRLLGLEVVLSRTSTALATLLCGLLKLETGAERKECKLAAKLVHRAAEEALVLDRRQINFYQLLLNHYLREGIADAEDCFELEIKKVNGQIAQESRRRIERAKRIAKTNSDLSCVYR